MNYIKLMFNQLIDYIYRSIKLDRSLYRNPENFHDLSIFYATIIIILNAVAGVIAATAIAANTNYSPATDIVSVTVQTILDWAVLSILLYIIGTKIFHESGTKADLKKVFTVVGFAHSPGLLKIIVVVIPGLNFKLIMAFVFFTFFWFIASLTIGIKEALNFKSDMKSFGVILIAFLIIAFIIYFILLFYL